MDNSAEIMLRIEAKKKSGWLAAFMNLVFPGAGYMYCGRWLVGILAALLVIFMYVEIPEAGLGISLLLFVDGFLSVSSYNKKLIENELKIQAEKKDNK